MDEQKKEKKKETALFTLKDAMSDEFYDALLFCYIYKLNFHFKIR